MKYFLDLLMEMLKTILPITGGIEQLIYIIREYQKIYPVNEFENLKYCEGKELLYIWKEENNQIQIAAEFKKINQTLKVHLVAKKKNSSFKATDLYKTCLKKWNKIISDESQTLQGLNIWKKLHIEGCQIGVYSNQERKIFLINHIDDFDKYSDKNSVFVAALEKEDLFEVWCLVETYRWKKKNGW